MNEWRPVCGFDGCYMITGSGHVFALRREGRELKKPRLIRSAPTSNGYLRVTLGQKGQRKTRFIHRMLLESFVGPCPAGMEALHLNDVKDDNRRENLRWGTHPENISMRKHARGESQRLAAMKRWNKRTTLPIGRLEPGRISATTTTQPGRSRSTAVPAFSQD